MALSGENTDLIVVVDRRAETRSRLAGRIHFLIGACMVAGMLGVGLYPFHSPTNGVSWLSNRNGIHLGRHATVLSESWVSRDLSQSTLEIWLEPAEAQWASTIAAFSTPEPFENLSLEQYFSTFIIKRQTPDAHGQRTVGVERVLYPGRRVFITITSGAQDSAIFVDGIWADTFRKLPLVKALTGRLVLGTSPEGHGDWHGNLLGLAIYQSELTPEQVLQHYRAWSREGRPDKQDDRLSALYLFNEHAGSVVHNATGGGSNLIIPKRYTIVHDLLLEPFWKEYKSSIGYYRDTLINLLGFIPLGFVSYTYWILGYPIKRAALASIALGFAISLTIEVLQSYLPTRSSGTTDLITNTMGTYLGVRLGTTFLFRRFSERIYVGPQ